MLRPNVSHCISENEVHYNPCTDPRLIVKYSAVNASQQTKLYHYNPEGPTAALMFDNVEIDGVNVSITDLDTAQGNYQFSVGEHIVKYTLKDPTSVTGYIFYGCSSLTSVTIPDSVTTIEDGAFDGCTSLTSVTIPDSVTSIGQSAFRDCTSLTSVSIPNSVTNIGDRAFRDCSGLTSVNIPNSVTNIGDRAFRDCSGLTSVNIPNSVTNIGDWAFSLCSGLTSVTIGNSVTTIEDGAFDGCTSLTSVTIPDSVTSIGNIVFWGCSGLTNIVSLATTAPTISSDTFQNIKANGTLTVPSGSSGYDVWMGTGNYYLGLYNWTKVEQ